MAGSVRGAKKVATKSASASPARRYTPTESPNASASSPNTEESRPSPLVRRLAIDPGDRHVGWVVACDTEITGAGVCGQAEFIRMLEEWLTCECLDEVICEDFVLYPWKAAQQGFNEFLTSQLIGVIKYLCVGGPASTAGAGRGDGLFFKPVPYIGQGADIKKGTFAQLKARGVKPSMIGSVPTNERQHAKDAQAHLWYRIWNS